MTTPVQLARLRVTGHYAGPASRAVAALLDGGIIFVLYTAGLAGVQFLASTFLGDSFSGDKTGPLAGMGLFVWAFVYVFTCLAVTGRTPGKAIVGLRVVRANGATLPVRRALLRTLVFPLSVLLLGLGLILIVFQREHRALHDLIAGTAVVYDWGDRPAEIPGPLSEFLSRADADPVVPPKR
jgi:uncharacterized RDD family membrane protein YckC